ncbi:MAG: DHH family phosphoesterase [Patescibacteria group bacterium]|jgi:phosphoesterase RecJ-like protein
MLSSEEQIFEQIKKANNILVVFPANWNGDAIASGLAMYLFLKKTGKKVELAAGKTDSSNLEAKSKAYSFLPAFSEIQRTIRDLNKFVISLDTTHASVKGIKYRSEENAVKFIISPKSGNFSPADVKIESEGKKYDLIITLDTPDLESLGSLFSDNAQFFYETPIINIDHRGGNEEYGQINLIKINAVSTSEMLLSLFKACEKDVLDADIATCLLTGIIAKTRNFRNANLTPDALSATSHLISHEARREEIVNKLYRSRHLGALKLCGVVLSRLTGTSGQQVVWSVVMRNDFLKTGADKNDLAEIADELASNLPEVKIIIIFYEVEGQNGQPSIRSLIHSPKNINLLDLMKDHNPCGDERMVEIDSKLKLEEIKEEIIALIDKKINQNNF